MTRGLSYLNRVFFVDVGRLESVHRDSGLNCSNLDGVELAGPLYDSIGTVVGCLERSLLPVSTDENKL